ncbi:hypothetical protein AB0E08_07715 [Streptomyces sp. NPDC048281]|uniref:hypothetical protein n=1 Tax=Streptomyces sp. NPDC048281 TaxID=3154715 RepID=UPI003441AA99
MISLRALVSLELDGVVHAPGAVLELPDGQEARAAELQRYGYAAEAPAEPVRTRRRRSSD